MQATMNLNFIYIISQQQMKLWDKVKNQIVLFRINLPITTSGCFYPKTPEKNLYAKFFFYILQKKNRTIIGGKIAQKQKEINLLPREMLQVSFFFSVYKDKLHIFF